MKYSEYYKEDLSDTIKNVKNIKKLKNKKILVTGATGLIGSAIVDSLIYANVIMKLDIKLYLASRSIDKLKNRFGQNHIDTFIEFVEYEASLDIDFKFKVDYIIHAASNAHPMAYSLYPVETMISNFYGINNLLKYSKNIEDSRIIYISSSEVYGNKTDNRLYREDDYGFIDILKPRSCYPSSKRAAESLCSSYKKEYNQDVVIVRPGHIYGPTMTGEDSRVFAQFARNILREENIVMKSSGLQLRSYCYVFDCVSAILTVLIDGKSGEAYNISNKNSIVTIRELAETFAKSSGKELIFENPEDVENLGYNMMQNSALDSQKLESLGWNGLYYLDEGVKRTLRILKENYNL